MSVGCLFYACVHYCIVYFPVNNKSVSSCPSINQLHAFTTQCQLTINKDVSHCWLFKSLLPFVGRRSVSHASVHASVHVSVHPRLHASMISPVLPRYLQYLLTGFCQTCHWCSLGQRWTYVILGSKVKVTFLQWRGPALDPAAKWSFLW